MKNNRLSLVLGSLALALSLLTSAGCNLNNSTSRSSVPTLEVNACGDETDKTKCDNSKQKSDGKHCKYNTVTGFCEIKPPPCKDQDEPTCKASNICTYDDTKKICEDADAAVTGKCEAIQVDSACTGTCAWDATASKCKTKTAQAKKKITTYTVARLDKVTTHNIDDRYLTGITASGDGEHVYVITSSNHKLKSLTVTGGAWGDVAGNWNANLIKAEDGAAAAADLSGSVVAKFAPTKEGLIFTLDTFQVVLLKKTGVALTSLYVPGAGDLNNEVSIPYFAKKGVDEFVYLVQTTAANGIKYKEYVAPNVVHVKDDVAGGAAAGVVNGPWNNSLKISAGGDLLARITAITQNSAGDLFLADVDGISKVNAADVGANGKFLAVPAGGVAGNPFYSIGDFSLDGGTTSNIQGIIAMATVGNYLLIGFASNNANNGGLVYADISVAAPVWKKYGAGLGIATTAITPANFGIGANTDAVVSTDKGLLIFSNGDLIEPVTGKGKLIAHTTADGNYFAHAPITAPYATAVSGFAGAAFTIDKNNVVGAAQDKNGRWYIAVRGDAPANGGVFTIDIAQQDVNP